MAFDGGRGCEVAPVGEPIGEGFGELAELRASAGVARATNAVSAVRLRRPVQRVG